MRANRPRRVLLALVIPAAFFTAAALFGSWSWQPGSRWIWHQSGPLRMAWALAALALWTVAFVNLVNRRHRPSPPQ